MVHTIFKKQIEYLAYILDLISDIQFKNKNITSEVTEGDVK